MTPGQRGRRERKSHSPRSRRVNLAYDEAELTIVQTAAAREGLAPAAWVARVALSVALEQLIPVSAGTGDVLRELIRARAELDRVRTDWAASDREPGDGSLAARVAEAVGRVDAATLQVMRERADRS